MYVWTIKNGVDLDHKLGGYNQGGSLEFLLISLWLRF